MTDVATVIPVAGGKGGVGKTLFTANLGLALAGLGCSTVVVDLDLGNSNLHSLLGMPNRFPGIGDYLRVGAEPLESFLVDTGVPRLRLLPGDGRMPFMANITHAQKMRLLTALRALPGDYVLLDLGAGCAFHTLDFFAMTDAGMILTSPEYPATMSALVFLKNMLLRKIEKALPKNPELADLLNGAYIQPMQAPQMTVSSLLTLAAEMDPDAGRRIREVCARCRPRLIFNMGDHPDDLKELDTLDRTIRQILSIEVDFFGFVFSDPAVRAAIRQGKALLTSNPESRAARDILQIATRVTRFWSAPVPRSAELLTAHTRKVFGATESSGGPASLAVEQ
jgi:flagellar biosynthesis protein FlhG